MWEAYLAETIPVGAVIVDEAGEVLSRGRNRTFDEPHDGQLGGSRLAHAEVNALLALSSGQTYEDFTLYTSLEPCHLCAPRRLPYVSGACATQPQSRTPAPSRSSSRAPITKRTR